MLSELLFDSRVLLHPTSIESVFAKHGGEKGLAFRFLKFNVLVVSVALAGFPYLSNE